jgi:hypothetical protein
MFLGDGETSFWQEILQKSGFLEIGRERLKVARSAFDGVA